MSIRRLIVLFCLLASQVLYAGYDHMVLDPYVEDHFGDALSGDYDVDVDFYASGNYDVSDRLFHYTESDVPFSKGYATIDLITDDSYSEILNTENVVAIIQVTNSTDLLEPAIVTINFYSVAYALRAYKANEVLYPFFSNLTENAVFENFISVNSSLTLPDTFAVSGETKKLVINGSEYENASTSVSGTVNALTLYRRDLPFIDSLSWARTDSNPHDSGTTIYYNDGPVWVNRESTFDSYALDVQGVLRADEFFVEGRRLSAALDWGLNADGDLYFTNVDGQVGIFSEDPVERLDIQGAISLKPYTEAVSTGSIYYDGSHFYGQLDSGLERLNSMQENGFDHSLALFGSVDLLDHDKNFLVDSDESDYAFLASDTYFKGITDDEAIFHIYDENGDMVVSVNDNGYFKVDGAVNADKLFLYGAPIELRVSVGDHFKKVDVSEATADLFYKAGNISIGRWKPTYNLLIASPLLEPDVPTIDPAITFTYGEDSDQAQFTMGIDADTENTFFLSPAGELGPDAPLLAMKRNFLGMGVTDPKYNLHVSGNKGILVHGPFQYFEEDVTTNNMVHFEKAGSIMFFNPYNSAFHASYVESDIPTFAEQRQLKNVGLNSVSFGKDNLAYGNFSLALGGQGNEVVGAYSTALGSHNKVDGYFSMAMGHGANVKHDGSFVFAQTGLFGSSSVLRSDISDSQYFSTTDLRQFLIGTSSASNGVFYGSSVGINTNDAFQTALKITPYLLSYDLFESIDTVTSENARDIFDSLVSQGVVSDDDDSYGRLLVPDEIRFSEAYLYHPILVTMNSFDLVQSFRNHVKDGALTSVTSANIKTLVPSDNWLAFYNYDDVEESFDRTEAVSAYRSWVDNQFLDISSFILSSYTNFELLDVSGALIGLNGSSYCSVTPATGFNELSTDVYVDVESYVADRLAALVFPLEVLEYYDSDDDGSLDSFTIGEPYTTDDFDLFKTYYSDTGDYEEKMAEFIFDHLSDHSADIDFCTDIPSVSFKSADFYAYVKDYYTESGEFVAGYTPDDFQTWIEDDVFPVFHQKVLDELVRVELLETDTNSDGIYDLADTSYIFTLSDINVDNGIPTEDVVEVLRSVYRQDLFAVRGHNKQQILTVEGDAKMGIGYTDLGTAQLSVSPSMLIMPSAEDTTVNAKFAIANPSTSSDESESERFNEFTFLFGPKDVTPSFMMNVSGDVGLFLDPSKEPFEQDEEADPVSTDFKLRVGGTIVANGLVDSDSGLEISADPPVVVWQYDTTPNIYFTSGNVGLGTATPNTLLHLATMSSDGSLHYPTMIYDLDGTDVYSLGYHKSDEPFMIKSASNDLLAATAEGVAVGTENVDERLHVDGDTILDALYITSNLTDTDPSLDMTYLAVDSLYFNGTKISASGYTWNIDPPNVYLNDPGGVYIGIGTDSPSVELEVSGSIKTTSLHVSDSAYIDNNFYAKSDMYLRDESISFISGYPMFVTDSELFIKIGADYGISNVFSKGHGTSSGNKMVAWSNLDEFELTRVQDFEFYEHEDNLADGSLWVYNDDAWELNPNYILTASAVLTINGGLEVDFEGDILANQVVFPGTIENVGLDVASSIDYDEEGTFYFDSYNHNFMDFDIDARASYINLIGLNIDLGTTDNATLFADTDLIGLNVDLEGVEVQESGDSTSGYKYAAIFNGDVSVGSIVPRTDEASSYENMLAIDGAVQAEGFVISDRLIVSSLNVGGSFFVEPDVRVGIGVATPDYELEAIGLIETDYLVAEGLESGSFDASTFSVLDNGKVKFGSNADVSNASVAYYKQFSQLEYPSFFYKTYTVQTTDNLVLEEDVTLFKVNFKSDEGDDDTVVRKNIFGDEDDAAYTAIGVKLDLSNIVSDPESLSTVNGLLVSMPDNSDTLSSNAAVFMGANVGIGTTTPDQDYALHIEGDFKALSSFGQNLGALNVLPEIGQIDNLVATYGVVIEEVATADTLYVDTLENSSLNLDELDLSDYALIVTNQLDSDAATINEVVTANTLLATRLNSPDATVTQLAVGRSLSSRSALSVSNLRSTALVSTNELISSTLNIASNLIVHDNGNVSLGSDSLFFPLAVRLSAEDVAFDAEDVDTWNPVYIESGAQDDQNHAELVLGLADSKWFIQATQEGDTTGNYNLAFFNQSDSSQSNLVISMNGNVGIATANPSESFAVQGDSIMTSLEADIVYVDSINLTDDAALQDLISFEDMVGFNSPVSVADPVVISTRNSDVMVSNKMALYYKEGASNVDTGLFFYSNFDRQASGNLSLTNNYEVGSLVYFADNYSLTPNNSLIVTYNEATTTLSMTVSGFDGDLYQVNSTIPSDNLSYFAPTVYSSRIDVDIEKRDDASDSILSAYSIDFGVTNNNSDTFIGVDVDLSDLEYYSYRSAGSGSNDYEKETVGTKIAALFRSGTVRIGSGNIAANEQSDDVLLWIKGDRNQGRYLIVDNDNDSGFNRYDLTIVSQSMGLNVVSDNMIADKRLEINVGSDESAFIVDNANEDRLLEIRESVLVVGGTSNVTSDEESRFDTLSMYVNAVMKGDEIRVSDNKTELESISFGEDAYFNLDEQNGKLGLGTTEPEAVLHSYRLINEDATGLRVRKGSVFTIEDDTSATVDTDIKGLAIDFPYQSLNSFDGSTTGASIKGLVFDASNLALKNAGTVRAVRVDGDRKEWLLEQVALEVARAQTLFTSISTTDGDNNFTDDDEVMGIAFDDLTDVDSQTELSITSSDLRVLLKVLNSVEQINAYNDELIALGGIGGGLNTDTFEGGSTATFAAGENDGQVFGGLSTIIRHVYSKAVQGKLTVGDLAYDLNGADPASNLLADMYAMILGESAESHAIYGVTNAIINITQGISEEYDDELASQIRNGDVYAAIFEESKVGIGTTVPNYDLDLSNGAIRASYLVLDNVPSATVSEVSSNTDLYATTVDIGTDPTGSGNLIVENDVIIEGMLAYNTTTATLNVDFVFEEYEGITLNELNLTGNVYFVESKPLNIGLESGSGVLNVVSGNSQFDDIVIENHAGTAVLYVDVLTANTETAITLQQDLELLSLNESDSLRLALTQLNEGVADPSTGELRVKDEKLLFNDGSKIIDLSDITLNLDGEEGQLAYYKQVGADSYITTNMGLRVTSFSATVKEMGVTGSIVISGSIQDEDLYTASSLLLDVSEREGGPGSTFDIVGLDILVTSTNYIGSDDVVGVSVNLSNLVHSFYSKTGEGNAEVITDTDGYKYPAIFRSGTVRIGSANISGSEEADKALLWIKGHQDPGSYLVVDTDNEAGLDRYDFVVVSQSIGIGVISSNMIDDKRLEINVASGESGLIVDNSIGTRLIEMREDVLVVGGTANVTADEEDRFNTLSLYVNDQLKADEMHVIDATTTMNAISFGTDAYFNFNEETGKLGLGTTEPEARLHSYQLINNSTGALKIRKGGHVDLVADGTGLVGSDVTGLVIDVRSNADNEYDGSESNKRIIGLALDASNLNLTSTGNLRAVRVDGDRKEWLLEQIALEVARAETLFTSISTTDGDNNFTDDDEVLGVAFNTLVDVDSTTALSIASADLRVLLQVINSVEQIQAYNDELIALGGIGGGLNLEAFDGGDTAAFATGENEGQVFGGLTEIMRHVYSKAMRNDLSIGDLSYDLEGAEPTSNLLADMYAMILGESSESHAIYNVQNVTFNVSQGIGEEFDDELASQIRNGDVIAAVFESGNVGIGTTEPQSALDLADGVIKASYISIEDWNNTPPTVAATELSIAGNLEHAGYFSVGNSIYADHIIIEGTLQFTSANHTFDLDPLFQTNSGLTANILAVTESVYISANASLTMGAAFDAGALNVETGNSQITSVTVLPFDSESIAYIDELRSSSGIIRVPNDQSVIVENFISANNLHVDQALHLNDQSSITNYQLASHQNGLIYQDGGGSTFNISFVLQDSENSLPYFESDSQIASSDLTFTSDTLSLSTGYLEVSQNISKGDDLYSLEQYNVVIGKRSASTVTATTFKGLDLSTTVTHPTTYDDENLIAGLYVDISELHGDYTTSLGFGEDVDVDVIAAVFDGAPVEIGAGFDYSPLVGEAEASLYVQSKFFDASEPSLNLTANVNQRLYPFAISSTTTNITENMLLMVDEFSIGIGTLNLNYDPDGSTVVTSDTFVKLATDNADLLSILDNDDASLFYVGQAAVGIGTSNPVAELEVLPFNNNMLTLAINNSLYVNGGNVGFVTSNPEARFEIAQGTEDRPVLAIKSGQKTLLDITSENIYIDSASDYDGTYSWAGLAGDPFLILNGEYMTHKSDVEPHVVGSYNVGRPTSNSFISTYVTENVLSFSQSNELTLSDNIRTFIDALNTVLAAATDPDDLITITKNMMPFWQDTETVPSSVNAVFLYRLQDFTVTWNGGASIQINKGGYAVESHSRSFYFNDGDGSATAFDCNDNLTASDYFNTSAMSDWLVFSRLDITYKEVDGSDDPYSDISGRSYFSNCENGSSELATLFLIDPATPDSADPVDSIDASTRFVADYFQDYDASKYPVDGLKLFEDSYTSFYDWVRTIDDLLVFLAYFGNLESLDTFVASYSDEINNFKQEVANLSYGGDDSENLSIMHDNGASLTNVMSLGAGGKVGVFESEPEADFHVTMPELSGQDFALNIADTFYITNEAKIGIGTSDPQYDLEVSGNMRVMSILDAEGGTALSVQSVTINETVTSTDATLSIHPGVVQSSSFAGNEIDLTLVADRKDGADLYAYHLQLTSDENIVDTLDRRRVYGVYADVSGIKSDDPKNQAYAAAFYSTNEVQANDTKVIIDTSVDREATHAGMIARHVSDHLVYNYPLNVYAPSTGADKLEDNVLARFVRVGYSDEDFMEVKFATRNAKGPVITSNLLAHDAFMSISESLMYTTDSNETLLRAQKVFDTLASFNFITTVNTSQGTMGYLANENWTSYNAIVTSWNEVFKDVVANNEYYDYIEFLPSENIIAVMANYLEQFVYTLKLGRVSGGAISSWNALSISTGLNPLYQLDTSERVNTVPRIGIGINPEDPEFRFTDTFNPISMTQNIRRVNKEALIVSGDIRVGILSATDNASGTGAADFYFSGGEQFGEDDNDDLFSIGRYDNSYVPSGNIDRLASTIRLRMLSNDTEENHIKTTFGYSVLTDNVILETYNPVMEITVTEQSDGEAYQFVGIGTDEDTVLNGHFIVDSETPTEAVLLESAFDSLTVGASTTFYSKYDTLQETSILTTNLLSLDYSLYGSDLDETVNFVSFVTNIGTESTPVFSASAAIEANNSGEGVQFSSKQRDYAEYVLKMNPDENIQAGDVVGIHGGRVSLKTKGADQIMVVSTAPIIVGNWPGKEKEHLYSLIAFLGQVPVKVKGKVSKGDLLIPSGKQDGYAVAISEYELSESSIDVLLGRAWEDHDGNDKDASVVNTYVGQAFKKDVLNKKLLSLEGHVDEYKQDIHALKLALQERLERRQALIEKMKLKAGL